MLDYGFTNPKDAEFAQAVLAEKESNGESTKGYFEELRDKIGGFAKTIADKAVDLVKKISDFFRGIFDGIFGWIYKKALSLEIPNPFGENVSMASILPNFMKRAYERAYNESEEHSISESSYSLKSVPSTSNNTGTNINNKVSSAQAHSIDWNKINSINPATVTPQQLENLNPEEKKAFISKYDTYIKNRNSNPNISSNVQATPSQQNGNMVGSIKIADAPNVFTNMLSVLQKIEQNTRINYSGMSDKIKHESIKDETFNRRMDGPEEGKGSTAANTNDFNENKLKKEMLDNMMNKNERTPKTAHPLYNQGGGFTITPEILKAAKDAGASL